MAIQESILIDSSRSSAVFSRSIIIPNIALDGIGRMRIVPFIAISESAISKIRMVYTEAAAISGGGVGTPMMLGTSSHPLLFATWNSEGTKAQWSVVEIPIISLNNFMATDEVMVFEIMPGKANAGVVTIQIDINEVR